MIKGQLLVCQGCCVSSTPEHWLGMQGTIDVCQVKDRRLVESIDLERLLLIKQVGWVATGGIDASPIALTVGFVRWADMAPTGSAAQPTR